ncbi:MAG: FAD-binding protein, partial [Raoultibacter sp.]
TRYANNYCNTRLYHIWAQNSGEAIDWYQDRVEEAGFQLFVEAAQNAKPARYKHWATGHIPSWPADAEFAGIKDVVNGKIVLGDYAKKKGVDFRFTTPLVKLVKEGDKVVGAIAKGSDGYIKINASKGVVVCTGGYARNDEMLKALQPQTLNKYSLSIAIDGTTGDGIKSCLWAGAHMDEKHTAMVFDRVAVKPDEFGGSETVGSLFWMGSNPWLKVNLNGERFTNESAPYDYVLNAAIAEPHNTIIDIWDSDYETYLEQFDIHGCARVFPFDNGAPTNMTLDIVKGINQGLLDNGYIVKADTIEELAKGLGIPADTLKKTVDRQNENFDNQVDPDFGKEDFRLSAIRTAPFYGVRTSGYMLCTLDGITINEEFQALDGNGEAIEGLYVTGVDSGSYYAETYPNMSTGNCCGRSVTFARMIGKALAAK